MLKALWPPLNSALAGGQKKDTPSIRSGVPSCTVLSTWSERICTSEYILSGCKFLLNNGRWTYRHDRVVKVMLDELERLLEENRGRKPKSSLTKFVKSGERSQGRGKKSFGLLERARDWVLLADIGACKLISHRIYFLLLNDRILCCTPARPKLWYWSKIRAARKINLRTMLQRLRSTKTLSLSR